MAGDNISKIKRTSQAIDNFGFDETYLVPTVLPLYESGGKVYRQGSGGPAWDYCDLTQATLTDTWVFKTGGSGGTTVQTIVVTYTDATKATISNVTKT